MADTVNTTPEQQAGVAAWAEVERGAALREPRAASVRYDEASGLVMITLTTGAVVGLPPAALSIPDGATPEQMAGWTIANGGEHVYWHDIDGGNSVPGAILMTLFGRDLWRMWSHDWDARYQEAKARILAEMRAKGGRARTPAKVAAAKANGKKGGRPRKLPPAAGA